MAGKISTSLGLLLTVVSCSPATTPNHEKTIIEQRVVAKYLPGLDETVQFVDVRYSDSSTARFARRQDGEQLRVSKLRNLERQTYRARYGH